MEGGFSERHGYISRILQVESLNNRTRNRLWDTINLNWLEIFSFFAFDKNARLNDEYKEAIHNDREFVYAIHSKFFGRSFRTYPDSQKAFLEANYDFFIACKWYECFDFIENIIQYKVEAKSNIDYSVIKEFESSINVILIQEKVAYRLVNSLILPITSEVELSAISNAISGTEEIKTVNSHLLQAIKHFSDREMPDYRNSFKEAIMALESLLTIIAGLPKGTMSDALKQIKRNDTLGLHQALQDSLNSLYGWAGDESGVRHKLKGESLLDSEDAKLAIVICCSMTTYIIAKASKAGIDLTNK